jgi:hypothetical protein
MTAAMTGAQPLRVFRPERALESQDTQTGVELRAGQLWRVLGNNCWRAILCREGLVWITQNRDLQDHVITAGEMFLISQPGTVIVQALAGARLELTPCLAAESFRGGDDQAIFP